jgi:phospholipid transport system substrate-binding protein
MKYRLIFSLLALLACVSASAQEADTRDPVTIIEETTAHILTNLDARRDEFTEKPALLRDLVNNDLLPLIDTEYSARLILGPAGRGVEPQQLSDFADAMSSVLLNRYADGLINFRSGEQIEVLPVKGKNTEKMTRVRTRLKLEKGGFVPIDYAFRKTPSGWKAFDVTVEGISYVITFRNQISPQVKQNGIEKVTADIRTGNIKLEKE